MTKTLWDAKRLWWLSMFQPSTTPLGLVGFYLGFGVVLDEIIEREAQVRTQASMGDLWIMCYEALSTIKYRGGVINPLPLSQRKSQRKPPPPSEVR